jgi:hypothetical protein
MFNLIMLELDKKSHVISSISSCRALVFSMFHLIMLELDKKVTSSLLYHLSFIVELTDESSITSLFFSSISTALAQEQSLQNQWLTGQLS